MSQLITRFYDVMREIYDSYSELAELAEKKTATIGDKNVDTLDAIVRQEQGAVVRLSHWEKQRLQCAEEMASMTGRTPADVTFLFFAEQAGDSELATNLRELHGKLLDVTNKLSLLNNVNKKLLEGKLEYTRFALQFLTVGEGTYSGSGAYRAPGYDNNSVDRSILDRKV